MRASAISVGELARMAVGFLQRFYNAITHQFAMSRGAARGCSTKRVSRV
jgi:hypothetical protein